MVAGGQAIMSSTAFADDGSVGCRYDFTGNLTLTTFVRNRTNNNQDVLQFSVSGAGGNCPCGGTAIIQYAYYVAVPAGSANTPWISSSAVSVTGPRSFWPNGGGSLSVGVSVRVTCPAAVGNAVRCRYGTVTYNVGAANFTQTYTLALSTNNGDDPLPNGLPACNSAPLAVATVAGGVAAPMAATAAEGTGGLFVVSGLLPDPGETEPALSAVPIAPVTEPPPAVAEPPPAVAEPAPVVTEPAPVVTEPPPDTVPVVTEPAPAPAPVVTETPSAPAPTDPPVTDPP